MCKREKYAHGKRQDVVASDDIQNVHVFTGTGTRVIPSQWHHWISVTTDLNKMFLQLRGNVCSTYFNLAFITYWEKNNCSKRCIRRYCLQKKYFLNIFLVKMIILVSDCIHVFLHVWLSTVRRFTILTFRFGIDQQQDVLFWRHNQLVVVFIIQVGGIGAAQAREVSL